MGEEISTLITDGFSFKSLKMSYGGFEYGGNDLMSGMPFDMAGGFLGTDEHAGKHEPKKMSREKQSLLPITIKQFLEASNENDTYKIDECDLYTVKIVGTIQSIQDSSTISTYYINDGTGVIECRHFRTDQPSSSVNPLCRENALVQVIANPRDYEGRRFLNIYDIKPLTDWNELTHHFLETIYVHLQNTKGSVPTTSSSIPYSAKSTSPSSFSSRVVSPSSSLGQENPLCDKVYDAFVLLRQDAGEEGVSVHQVFRFLSGTDRSLAIGSVQKEIANLCDQASIYATIENHYLPTDL